MLNNLRALLNTLIESHTFTVMKVQYWIKVSDLVTVRLLRPHLTRLFWIFIPTNLLHVETAHTTALVSKPCELQDVQNIWKTFPFLSKAMAECVAPGTFDSQNVWMKVANEKHNRTYGLVKTLISSPFTAVERFIFCQYLVWNHHAKCV